jgi:serine/threonine-protein kinase
MPHDSPAGTTIPLSPPGSVGAVVARPIRAASGFDEELRQLLRSRLLLFQLLTIVYAALLMVMAAFTPEDSQVRSDQVQTSFSVMLILPLIGTVAIWRSPGMSLRSLRLWELFQFSSQAIINGVFRFAALALATSAMPVVEVGFRGAISLFGIMTLILAYGVLIPNTPRRSLLVVLGLIAVPFAALIAATAANPALRWDHFPALVFQAGANLFIPAAIAVFAAARANALQRRAFEAERRANEIGQYMLKDKLGEGGMGVVWLADLRLLNRPCAV